ARRAAERGGLAGPGREPSARAAAAEGGERRACPTRGGCVAGGRGAWETLAVELGRLGLKPRDEEGGAESARRPVPRSLRRECVAGARARALRADSEARGAVVVSGPPGLSAGLPPAAGARPRLCPALPTRGRRGAGLVGEPASSYRPHLGPSSPPGASGSPGSAEAAASAPRTSHVCYVTLWRQNKVVPQLPTPTPSHCPRGRGVGGTGTGAGVRVSRWAMPH
ncbi:hypothetical protein MC885_009001, partial [Smutsia gigantea]